MRPFTMVATTLFLITTIGCGGSKNSKTSQNPKKVAKNQAKAAPKKEADSKKKQDSEDNQFRIIKPDNPAAVSNLKDLAKNIELDDQEHVVSLSLAKLEVDRQLKYVQKLKHIHSLQLVGDEVLDKHLKAIGHLKDLKKLILNDVAITDEGLKHIAEFASLEELQLPSAKIGDAGVAHLAKLEHLRVLNLMYTDISDSSVQSLLKLNRLENLDVSFTKVSQLTVSSLKKLPSLKSISLRFSEVDDEQVELIRKELPKLVVNGMSGVALARNQREETAKQPLLPQQLAVGKEVPEIVGEDISGKSLKLSEFRGKVVVIDFWGFWCSACVRDIPHLRGLHDRLKAHPFVLLGVNSDAVRKDLLPRLSKEKIAWRSWWDGSGGPIARRWGTRAWPTTYVIDQKGIIRFKDVRGKALDKAVDQLIKEVASKETKPGKK